jgi:hypothetical protein
MPATAPSAGSSRSSRTRIQRTTSHTSTSHCTGSSVYGVSQCPAIVIHSVVACTPAVSVCARRSPPSSRAMSAATTTAAAVARTAGSRSARIDPGAIPSIDAASSGVSGGWSAEPQSRWWRPMASM